MLTDIKSEPVWSSHLDDDTGKVYFFNRVNKARVDKKPENFDGHYVIGETTAKVDNSIYENTFGDLSKKFCTPMDKAMVAAEV